MKPEATQEAHSVRIGESADYRYWAFISYSHADKAWGDWLHRALETYRVPKHLVGRVGAFGPVPRRLYPIFRDREELSASSSLGINIKRALQQSRSLIVICSPRSSSSHWVNEEIKYFKSLNREDRILAFMVEGEPNASDGRAGVSPDQECFPEALRFRVGADGELTQERTEPIAGDARKTKDGKLNAKLKLIAGLIGVDYDALKQRDQERRRRYLVALTTLASVAALAMTGLAIFAFGAEREAQMQAKAANAARDQADGLINFMLTDLRDKLQPIGHLNILSDVTDKARAYLDGLPNEQMNATRLRQRALMLSNLGQVLQAQGKLSDAVDAYRQELKITQRLVKENGSSAYSQSDLSNSYNSLGDALRDMSNLQDALDALRQASAIDQQLVERDKTNPAWQYRLALSYRQLGDVLEVKGSLPDALDAFNHSLTILRALTEHDPSNASGQRLLSVIYNEIGDNFGYQGKLQGALDAYQQGLGIIKALAEKDNSNTDWQYDLSVSYDRMGDALQARGDLAGALESYQKSLNIKSVLTEQDRSNAKWQRNLAMDYENVGDVLKAQGKLLEASGAYQTAMQMCKQLADRDKANDSWQDDLGSSYGKIGDVLLAQGRLSGALDAYQQGLEINKGLIEKDRSRADWQHDLSVSYEKLGDVLVAQRKPIEALDDYQHSLKLRQTLADQDRSNGGWQNDLCLSYEKIGDTLKAQGKPEQALSQYEQSLSIRRALVARDKSNTGWEHDLIALLVEVATTQSLSRGDDKVAEAKALLQEATNLAAEYSGSDRQALIDSINHSSRSMMVGQAPR